MKNLNKSIGVIFLHPGCNMTCKFCVTEDSFSSMSMVQATRLIDYLKEQSIINVVLGGGEPFSWSEDILRLASYAKKKGFFVQVGTNGVALPHRFETIDSIDRYVLPLDSIDSFHHNYFRQYKNKHHEIILEHLKKLKQAKRPVTVSTVVTRQNFERLKEIGLFLRKYNDKQTLHAWHLYQFIPRGRGGKINAPYLSINPEDYQQSCNELKQMNLGFTIYKRKDMYHSKMVDFFWYEGKNLHIGSEEFRKASSDNRWAGVA